MRLLLFDIDGTLVRCGRQVRVIFAEALQEVFGTHGALDGYSFSGKTDPRIVTDLMCGAGFTRAEVAERLPAMRDAYLSRLEARLDGDAIEVLPGVRELLAAAAQRSDVAVGLVTGNWQRGASAKLGRVGLADWFPFGAFGDDGEDRNCLPPVALQRAHQALGRELLAGQTLIIGDSVEDVRCARACGLPSLAVATGWTPAAALQAEGPDRLVPRLDEVADWVLDGGWVRQAGC